MRLCYFLRFFQVCVRAPECGHWQYLCQQIPAYLVLSYLYKSLFILFSRDGAENVSPPNLYIFLFSLAPSPTVWRALNLITSSESILLLTQMNNIGQRFPSEIRIKEVHLHPSLEFARAPGRSKPKRVSCPAEEPSLTRREPHTAVKTPVAHPETRLPRLRSWGGNNFFFVLTRFQQ